MVVSSTWRSPEREKLACELFPTSTPIEIAIARINALPGPRKVRCWREVDDWCRHQGLTRPSRDWKPPERWAYVTKAISEGIQPSVIYAELQRMEGPPLPRWETVQRTAKNGGFYSTRSWVHDTGHKDSKPRAPVVLEPKNCIRCRKTFMRKHKGEWYCDNCRDYAAQQGAAFA